MNRPNFFLNLVGCMGIALILCLGLSFLINFIFMSWGFIQVIPTIEADVDKAFMAGFLYGLLNCVMFLASLACFKFAWKISRRLLKR